MAESQTFSGTNLMDQFNSWGRERRRAGKEIEVEGYYFDANRAELTVYYSIERHFEEVTALAATGT